MGYVDGKTDADLLLEEEDVEADQERILVLKVVPPPPTIVRPGYLY